MSWRSYPLEALQSPVSVEELRGFLVYPAFTTDETNLAETLLRSSAAAVSDELQRDVVARRRRLEVPCWPYYGTRAGRLSGGLSAERDYLTLPYGPVQSVESVLVDGEAFSDYELDGDRLEMEPQDKVVVEYTAGFSDATDSVHFTPPQVPEAILTLAAWRWHHRGESAADALKNSGVLDALAPIKVPML